MQEPKGFSDFYGHCNRSARADGGADLAIDTLADATGGKTKMSGDEVAAIIAGIGSFIAGLGSGVGSVIDSANAYQKPTAGVQYMNAPSSNDNSKTLLWVLGGALVLVLLLVLVLRKK